MKSSSSLLSSYESQLQELQRRRRIIDERVEHKMSLFAKLQQIERDSHQRQLENWRLVNERALERNAKLLSDVRLYCHDLQHHPALNKQSSASHQRLQDAKSHYYHQLSRCTQVYRTQRQAELQNKLQEMREEKAKALERAEYLRRQRLEDVQTSHTYELQRQDLLAALANEHHERLQNKALQMFYAEQVKATDEAFANQISADAMMAEAALVKQVQALRQRDQLLFGRGISAPKPLLSERIPSLNDLGRAAVDEPLTPEPVLTQSIHLPTLSASFHKRSERTLEIKRDRRPDGIADVEMESKSKQEDDQPLLKSISVDVIAQNEHALPKPESIAIEESGDEEAEEKADADEEKLLSIKSQASSVGNLVQLNEYSSDTEISVTKATRPMLVRQMAAECSSEKLSPVADVSFPSANISSERLVVEQETAPVAAPDPLPDFDALSITTCQELCRLVFLHIESCVETFADLRTIYPQWSREHCADYHSDVFSRKYVEYYLQHQSLDEVAEKERIMGSVVMRLLTAKGEILLPKEAFLGVVSTDKLRREQRKKATAEATAAVALWEDVCRHCRRLLKAVSRDTSAVAYLARSSVFGDACIAYVDDADEHSRMHRKVQNFLQLIFSEETLSASSSPDKAQPLSRLSYTEENVDRAMRASDTSIGGQSVSTGVSQLSPNRRLSSIIQNSVDLDAFLGPRSGPVAELEEPEIQEDDLNERWNRPTPRFRDLSASEIPVVPSKPVVHSRTTQDDADEFDVLP